MSLDTYAGVEGYQRWNQQLNNRFQPPGNPYALIPAGGAITEPVFYQTDQMAREAINLALQDCVEEDRKIKGSILDIHRQLDSAKELAVSKRIEVDGAAQLVSQEKHEQEQDRRRVQHQIAKCSDLVGETDRLEQNQTSQLTRRLDRFEAEFQGNMHVIQLRIRNLVDAIQELEAKEKV